MFIEVTRDEGCADQLYLELLGGHSGSTNERELAPGVRGGYTDDGRLAFVEVVAGASRLADLDRLVAVGLPEILVEEKV